jgi:hypothetical protein
MEKWMENGKFDLFISIILILYLFMVQAAKVLHSNKLSLLPHQNHLHQVLVLLKLHPICDCVKPEAKVVTYD